MATIYRYPISPLLVYVHLHGWCKTLTKPSTVLAGLFVQEDQNVQHFGDVKNGYVPCVW